MSNSYFIFKQFTINQGCSVFKVGTDGVLLGASADVDNVSSILDIGTGTGLIALMLAQRCNAEIKAIEPDHESFEQACSNVKESRWASQIEVQNIRLQDYDPGSLRFDLLVSNPPFFSDSLRNPEPAKASARHNDYLSNKDLFEGSGRLLSEGGRLQVIMPYVEGNVLIAEAQEYGLYCSEILKIKPLPTSEIRRLILTFSRQKQKTTEKFLTIEHDRRHEFTEEYKKLTKDYYLKF